ncbi:hypothetical protein VTK56DRAFT_5777 [Thermocarpiscus australiensis]
MVTFDELFIRLPAFRVAVCREHRSAVTAASVVSHVNSYHSHSAARVRQRIAEEASALRDDGSLAADVHGIRFPSEVVVAIDGLPIWSDGKRCVQCGHIRRTRNHIQRHCRSAHGWVNPRKRGGKPGARPAGGLGEAWVDGVHCQRFGQDGALQRLFEVVPPAAGNGQSDDRPGSTREAVRAEFEASARAIKEKDEAAAAAIGEQSRLSANMWVRRMGWPRHLRGFDREWLAATTRQPDAGKAAMSGGREGDQDRGRDQDRGGDEEGEASSREGKSIADDEAQSEAALAMVVLAVERVIWQAQKASQVDVVGSAAIHYIERREVGGESNEKPFNAGQKGTTMAKYSAVWTSAIAYIWRTRHLKPVEEPGEGAEGEGSDGDIVASGWAEDSAEGAIRDRRPAYHFTGQQAKAFERMRTAAYAAVGARDEGETGRASASPGSSRSAGEDDTRELEGHVLDFFIALLDHDIGDNEYQNALYSGLAVLGIQAEYGWRSALVYTPVLSAIVTVARMLVLYKAKGAREAEVQRRRRAAGESEAEARRRARSHFDRVREMAQRFMTIVAYDGRPSPMDSVLRLRAYGKAIRANTNADGVVDWHGDELLFGHVQFSMASLRAMIHGLLHAAGAHLRRAVLLLDVDEDGEPAAATGRGDDAAAGSGATTWPAIQWDRLADNAAETRAGWSFAEDPRNREAFGGQRRDLPSRALLVGSPLTEGSSSCRLSLREKSRLSHNCN